MIHRAFNFPYLPVVPKRTSTRKPENPPQNCIHKQRDNCFGPLKLPHRRIAGTSLPPDPRPPPSPEHSPGILIITRIARQTVAGGEYEEDNTRKEHKFFLHTRMEAIYGTGHKYGHFTKDSFRGDTHKTCTSPSPGASQQPPAPTFLVSSILLPHLAPVQPGLQLPHWLRKNITNYCSESSAGGATGPSATRSTEQLEQADK